MPALNAYRVNNFVITISFISIQVLGLTTVPRNYIKLLNWRHLWLSENNLQWKNNESFAWAPRTSHCIAWIYTPIKIDAQRWTQTYHVRAWRNCTGIFLIISESYHVLPLIPKLFCKGVSLNRALLSMYIRMRKFWIFWTSLMQPWSWPSWPK